MTLNLNLEVKSLSLKRNRVPVLTDLNMSVRTGILGILGPNGAGKSTFLAVLATLLKVPSKSVSINGHDLATASGKREARRITGFQPQHPSFVPSFTVRESIEYAAWLKGMKNNREQVDEALRNTNTYNLQTQKVNKISGGQQKRVSIAQAIVHSPHLLLLDEPTASLDPHERSVLLNVLNEVSERCTLIMTTHNARDIAESCTDVLVMRDGIFAYSGLVEDFAAEGTSPLPDRIDQAYSKLTGGIA